MTLSLIIHNFWRVVADLIFDILNITFLSPRKHHQRNHPNTDMPWLYLKWLSRTHQSPMFGSGMDFCKKKRTKRKAVSDNLLKTGSPTLKTYLIITRFKQSEETTWLVRAIIEIWFLSIKLDFIEVLIKRLDFIFDIRRNVQINYHQPNHKIGRGLLNSTRPKRIKVSDLWKFPVLGQ